MEKIYTSLGLMSGTSMDGIDASIIKSNGEDKYEIIFDQYFKYDEELYSELINIRDKINFSKDLKSNSILLNDIEKKITLFHADICKKILEENHLNIDIIGFHGQTIFHNVDKKISRQLGDGYLLSSLLKKKVVYNFRENDIINGGQGAPLAPIFHHLVVKQNNIKIPVCILNIGGITNITIISSKNLNDLKSYDIGPGNCLLDEWIRKHTRERYDREGEIARIGKTSETILNKGIDNFYKIKNNKLSFDIKDFDLNFVRGLSLEDGLSTLTDFTATIVYQSIVNAINLDKHKELNILVCGGGRKNKFLLKRISMKLKCSIQPIDNFGFDGDFIESQAFAYLAIRSYLKLPISFPSTTGVKKASTGGRVCKY